MDSLSNTSFPLTNQLRNYLLQPTNIFLLLLVLLCMQESLANYYPLSTKQCTTAVESLGEFFKTQDSSTVFKGTFVSPR